MYDFDRGEYIFFSGVLAFDYLPLDPISLQLNILVVLIGSWNAAYISLRAAQQIVIVVEQILDSGAGNLTIL